MADGFQQKNRRISWELSGKGPAHLPRWMFLGRALGAVTVAVATLFLRAGLLFPTGGSPASLPILMLQDSRHQPQLQVAS